MAAQGGTELFVIIDNYDDLAEEIERIRDLSRDLAGLARRFGRDGLHFIIAGALDSGISELRRRVQAANYGIGLRTAQAVETLRVGRTPAEVRGKELQIGRGFIVKSGQPTMIQAASPYLAKGFIVDEAAATDEDQAPVAQALDRWVERIQARYPDQQAVWANPAESAASVGGGGAGPSAKALRLMSVLQLGLRQELAQIEAGAGAANLVTAKLVELDMAGWSNEEKLMPLLKELWINQKRASGLPEEMIQMTLGIMDDESIVFDVEAALTPE
jgi:hypothetical protein